MQAVMKTPRIEINIKGQIPQKLLAVLEDEFGGDIQLTDDDEAIDIFQSEWYANIKKR